MAEFLLPKQIMRVRFPLPAPYKKHRFDTMKKHDIKPFLSFFIYFYKNNLKRLGFTVNLVVIQDFFLKRFENSIFIFIKFSF